MRRDQDGQPRTFHMDVGSIRRDMRTGAIRLHAAAGIWLQPMQLAHVGLFPIADTHAHGLMQASASRTSLR